MIIRRLTVLCSAVLLLTSCSNEPRQPRHQHAMGEIGDVAVLTDQKSWALHSEMIDSVFAQDIPGMAGSEPFFVIRKADEAKFDGFYKRNYNLFVLVQQERWNRLKILFGSALQEKIEKKFKGNGISVFKASDVWATPQEVHFIIVPNDAQMELTLRNKRASFLNQALETEGRTTVQTLVNRKLNRDTFYRHLLVNKRFAIRTPITYKVGLRSEECTGITRYMNAKKLSMYVFEEPYLDENQFSQDSIIARRNKVLGRHVQGVDRADGIRSYMSTDTVNVKLFRRQMELNGLYAIETRGWWELENDHKAGPFVNYTILSTKTNRIITLDGSVFAPGHSKNRLIRQLELIAATFVESE